MDCLSQSDNGMRHNDDDDGKQDVGDEDGEDIFWTTRRIERMVEMYSGHPELYDSTNSQYHEKTARANALHSIATSNNTTGKEVFRKMRSLRTQYTRYRSELLQMSPGERQVNGGGITRKRSWLLSIMSFIEPFIRTPKLPPLDSNEGNISDSFLQLIKAASCNNSSYEVMESSQQPASTLDREDDTCVLSEDESADPVEDKDLKQEVVDDCWTQHSRVARFTRNKKPGNVRTRVSEIRNVKSIDGRTLRTKRININNSRLVSNSNVIPSDNCRHSVSRSSKRISARRKISTTSGHDRAGRGSSLEASDTEPDIKTSVNIEALMDECQRLVNAVTVTRERRDEMALLGNSDVEFGRYVAAELMHCKSSDAKALAKLKISQALIELHLHQPPLD